MSTADVIPLRGSSKNESDVCSHCGVRAFCLPIGLDIKAEARLEKLNKKTLVCHKGDVLFKPGTPFNQLYVVRSGSFKTIESDLEPFEQITSFNLPGEMLGFDALSEEKHRQACIALETSSVCQLTFKELFLLAAEIPSLQRRLLTLASQKKEAPCYRIPIHSSAIVRLSIFLLNLSTHFKRRNLSPVEFYLSMSRQDIANYLGLTIETTSRMFSKLQQQGIIQFDKRNIHILDLRQLQTIAYQSERE